MASSSTQSGERSASAPSSLVSSPGSADSVGSGVASSASGESDAASAVSASVFGRRVVRFGLSRAGDCRGLGGLCRLGCLSGRERREEGVGFEVRFGLDVRLPRAIVRRSTRRQARSPDGVGIVQVVGGGLPPSFRRRPRSAPHRSRRGLRHRDPRRARGRLRTRRSRGRRLEGDDVDDAGAGDGERGAGRRIDCGVDRWFGSRLVVRIRFGRRPRRGARGRADGHRGARRTTRIGRQIRGDRGRLASSASASASAAAPETAGAVVAASTAAVVPASPATAPTAEPEPTSTPAAAVGCTRAPLTRSRKTSSSAGPRRCSDDRATPADAAIAPTCGGLQSAHGQAGAEHVERHFGVCQRRAQRRPIGRVDDRGVLRRIGEVVERALEHEPALRDDQQRVDRLLHLGEQVRRDEHGSALARELAQEAAHPLDALGIEAVRGLVENEDARDRRGARTRVRAADACRARTRRPCARRHRRVRRGRASRRRARPAAPPPARRPSDGSRPCVRGGSSTPRARRRRSAAACASDEYGAPPIVAVPPVARTSPSRIRRLVVLPAPFGPRKPVTRPGSTRAEKSETAVTAPNRFVTPENSSTCPSGIPNLSSSSSLSRSPYPGGKRGVPHEA